MPAARRWTTCWIPPGAGGKSGVRTRRRGLRDGRGPLRLIESAEPIGPQPESEQRPDLIAVVVASRCVLGRERGDCATVEVTLLVEHSAVELAPQYRREGAAQPLGGWHPERRLAVALAASCGQDVGGK